MPAPPTILHKNHINQRDSIKTSLLCDHRSTASGTHIEEASEQWFPHRFRKSENSGLLSGSSLETIMRLREALPRSLQESSSTCSQSTPPYAHCTPLSHSAPWAHVPARATQVLRCAERVHETLRVRFEASHAAQPGGAGVRGKRRPRLEL